MLFQTPEFCVLLVAVLLGITLCGRSRSRQHWLLLGASYVFYGWWDVRFLMLLLVSSIVDYSAALGVAGEKLSWQVRIRISAIVFVATMVCLGVNWPAVQGAQSLPSSASDLISQWPGASFSIAICFAFAFAGPFLYELYFLLDGQARRAAFLCSSVAVNLGILGFFKYYNFFLDNLCGLGGLLGLQGKHPVLDLALPVGISFYTFQTMSYTIDVYRGLIQPDRSLRRVALYVAYFPQLVAGPILRPAQFLPTLSRPWTISSDHLTSGFHLAIVGLFKKVIIADSVAGLVNGILNAPQGRPSLLIYLAVILFAAQIYCDFSGYTDIARGVSRMFGVDIPLNFNYPYFSTSMIEFWRRWHISLSTWLRDYLYIPLGGNRGGDAHVYSNLMTTMVLGGLWHGAAWNFVIWGAYHGILLCVNRKLRSLVKQSQMLFRLANHPVGIIVRWACIAYLVMLGWLIFRVSGTEDLWCVVRKFIFFDGRWDITGLGVGAASPFTAVIALAGFLVLHAVSFFWKSWPEVLDSAPRRAQIAVYFLLGMIFFFAWPSQQEPFIYFQF